MEDTVFLILIGAAVALWIYYLVAKEFYKIAEMKGHAESKYLWISFLLGVVGWMLVIALPDDRKQKVQVVQQPQPVSGSQSRPARTDDDLPNL